MHAELLARSNFSFLRGASSPEELVERAVALGYGALGLADLDGVYGLAKAWFRSGQLGGLKLLAGAELTLEAVDGRGGLALLARDKAGWSLLCRLITASHADKPKGQAGLAWPDFLRLAQADGPGRAGLLALPRGAGLGEDWLGCGAPEDPRVERWDAAYGPLAELFGGGLLLPVGRFLDGRDAARTAAARQLQARYGAAVAATNDVHCHAPERRPLQDALACVREHCDLATAGFRLMGNAERHLKSPLEMRRLFGDWPQALEAAAAAAETCAFSLGELRYRYPSEWIPEGESAQSWLSHLAWEGAAWRFPQGLPEDLRAMLERELALVAKLGFADYFLTVQELVEFARAKGILCQGRGSAANSVLCFVLGVTSVNPAHIGLLFERFLSEERAEPPDIDVDFEHERREEVIQHLYEKYGRHRAAMVAAVIKYRSRSARADFEKVLGGFDGESLMAQVQDFPRHLSIHSGGFVLSGEPLSDLVPIEPGRMPGRTVVQWDKFDLDYLGMMKVDVLALGMLSALKRGLDLLGLPDLAAIPLEDPATYAMLRQADTLGVFQVESRAQMNMLGRLQPADFYDLVIEVAIVRPGPIVGQMVPPYLRRRRGLEEVRYEHPALERILKKTLGVPLFQEQVMRIAVELAGFSPGESDELRRAISGWRADGRLSAMGARLESGLKASGLSDDFCRRLFDEIKGFASYGFPESHAASFALLVYASAWMKCRHPAVFACALLNAQPLGFYAAHSLVDDAKRHGVEVLGLDPAVSGLECALERGALRLGWSTVDGLGRPRAEALLAARTRRPFDGLDDFAKRSGLPFLVLRRLALAGAFQGWGFEPRAALWRVLLLQAAQWPSPKGQLSLDLAQAGQPAPDFDPLDALQSVQAQYQAFGLSAEDHPMARLRARLARPCPPLARIRAAAKTGQRVRVQGLLIVRQHPGTAKGVVFATLEDESGLLDLVFWPRTWERLKARVEGDHFWEARGELQRDGDSTSLLVESVQGLRLPGEAESSVELSAASHDWH
jgi:error-prone DNA polymerase